MAYADVYDLMDMTEELVAGLVHHIHGSYKTKFHTAKGEEIEINWEAPWRRIEMIPTLEELVGEKFPPGDQLHTAETGEFLKKILIKTKVECSPPLTNARMLDALVGEFLEEQCVSIKNNVTPCCASDTNSGTDQPYLHHWSPSDDVPSGQELSLHPWYL